MNSKAEHKQPKLHRVVMTRQNAEPAEPGTGVGGRGRGVGGRGRGVGGRGRGVGEREGGVGERRVGLGRRDEVGDGGRRRQGGAH